MSASTLLPEARLLSAWAIPAGRAAFRTVRARIQARKEVPGSSCYSLSLSHSDSPLVMARISTYLIIGCAREVGLEFATQLTPGCGGRVFTTMNYDCLWLDLRRKQSWMWTRDVKVWYFDLFCPKKPSLTVWPWRKFPKLDRVIVQVPPEGARKPPNGVDGGVQHSRMGGATRCQHHWTGE